MGEDRGGWRNVDGNEGQILGIRSLGVIREAWARVMFNNTVTCIISCAICISPRFAPLPLLSNIARRVKIHRAPYPALSHRDKRHLISRAVHKTLRLNIVVKTREIFHGRRVFPQDCEHRDSFISFYYRRKYRYKQWCNVLFRFNFFRKFRREKLLLFDYFPRYVKSNNENIFIARYSSLYTPNIYIYL